MLNSVLLGVVFGVMALTGVAVAYNQFHVETTPDANIFSMLTEKQMAQIEAGESINNIELDQEQVDEIIKTLEHVNEYEIELIKQIGKFELQVIDAAKNFSPKVIARYCYSLAVAFNAFYEHVKVLDGKDQSLTNERLCLVFAFQSTLKKALDLLGIAAPNRM